MRNLNMVWRVGLVAWVLSGSAANSWAANDAAVAQYQFAGCAQLAQNTNFSLLKKIWTLPSSIEFKDYTLQRASIALSQSLASEFKAPASAAGLLRPLLDDLLQSESAAVFDGAGNEPLSFVLAVRANRPDQAKLWQDTLTQVLKPAPTKVEAEGFSGLEWKGAQAWRLFAAKDWVILSAGERAKSTQSAYLKQLRTQGRPVSALKENWLEGDADWAKLSRWLPLGSLPVKLGRTQFTCSGQADNLRTTVKVTYPESIQWRSEPWQIPQELAVEPLISFTAGQNVMAFLKPNNQLSQLPLNPLAKQFFVWAQGSFTLQTAAAVPVQNGTNVLAEFARKAPALFNPALKQRQSGELTWEPKKGELQWQGLQMMIPYLRAVKTNSGEYLVAHLFPPPPKAKPAPKELWQQIVGRKDLIYYDWELTGPRLQQWVLLSQVLPVFPPRKPGATVPPKAGAVRQKSPARIREQWLRGIEPLLNNAATEISRTGANEITIVRKSQVGLTAFELVMLSHWITTPTTPAAAGK